MSPNRQNLGPLGARVNASADPVAGFQHDNVIAFSLKFVSSGKTGYSCTNHNHLALVIVILSACVDPSAQQYHAEQANELLSVQVEASVFTIRESA